MLPFWILEIYLLQIQIGSKRLVHVEQDANAICVYMCVREGEIYVSVWRAVFLFVTFICHKSNQV